MTIPVLSTTALVAGYSRRNDVLHGVGVTLGKNEIITLVGPNGAGKSTLLKAIMGLLVPRSGQVTFDGIELAGLQPSEINARGIGYVPQRDNVFAALSVVENLEVGMTSRPDLPLRGRLDTMYAIFKQLGERRRQLAGSLSGGEQRMLALARALMPNPKVLLLDEPSAGLAPRIADTMFEQVSAISRSGTAILMVEQNAARALAMSHRGYVLVQGRNVYEGAGPTLARDGKIAELCLGGIVK